MVSRLKPRWLTMLSGVLAVLYGAAFIAPAAAQQGNPPAVGQDHTAPLELPPLPQHKPPPGEKFGDWIKRCQPANGEHPKRCFISQVVILSRNNQKHGVLFVAMGYYGRDRTPGVILRVPLGLGTYLPAGLLLNVPGAKARRIVIETCLPGGCNAGTKLSPELIAAMQKANRGTVEVVNIRRQKLVLPISFKGFTAGFASLDKG